MVDITSEYISEIHKVKGIKDENNNSIFVKS